MRKFILWSTLALVSLGGGGLLQAAEIPWFSIEPWQDATIEGAAGSTVGWGFYIYNYDTTYWIAVAGVTPQFQTNASLMTGWADFMSTAGAPNYGVIAPDNEWWVPAFNLGTQSGIGAYTINPAATPGASDSGILRLEYHVYDGDPLADGVFVESVLLDIDYSPTYTVTVSGDVDPPSEVPEPSTAMLIVPAVLAAIALRRRR